MWQRGSQRGQQTRAVKVPEAYATALFVRRTAKEKSVLWERQVSVFLFRDRSAGLSLDVLAYLRSRV